MIRFHLEFDDAHGFPIRPSDDFSSAALLSDRESQNLLTFKNNQIIVPIDKGHLSPIFRDPLMRLIGELCARESEIYKF